MAPQLLPPAKKKIGAESGSIIKASTFIPEKKKKIKSSAIVKADPTGIVKQDKESTAIVKQFGGANKSLVKITNLVQTDLKEDTKKYKKDKEEKAREKDKKKKEDIEKRLESGFGLKIPNIGGLKIPGIKAPGFFNRIFGALMWLGLGWIVDKLLDKESWFNKIGQALLSLGKFLDENLPKVVEGIFGFAQKAFPFVTGAGKLLFDSLVFMLDSIVKPYDQLRSFVGDKYGQKGLDQLDGFLSKFDKFVDGLLIFGTAWTLLDDGKGPSKPRKDGRKDLTPAKGGKAPAKLGQGISPPTGPSAPSAISTYLGKDPRSLSTRRKFGPTAQKIFDNSFANALASGKTKTQARRTADAAVQKAIKSGRITPEKLIGLAGPGQKAGRVLKGGVGRSAKRLAIQKMGRKGYQQVASKASASFAKGLFKSAVARIGAGRIPIVGPLFVALASFLDGDPPTRTLYKSIGAGLGQAIGIAVGGATGIGAFAGPFLGGFIGEFLGDGLYQLIHGGGIGALKGFAVDALRAVVRNLLRTPKIIVDGVMAFWSQLKNVPQLIVDGITKLIQTMGNISKFVGDLIKNIWNTIRNFDYFGFMKDSMSWLMEKGKLLWDNLVKLITPSIQRLLGRAGEIYTTIISRAESYLKNPLLIFKDLYNFNINSYKKLWEIATSMFDFAKEKLSSIDWKKLAFDSLTYIGNLAGNVGQFMKDMMKRIGEYALDIGKQALDVVNVIIDKGKRTLSYLTDQITRALAKSAKLLFRTVFPHMLWRALKSFSNSISGGLNNFVKAIDNIPLIPEWVKKFARSTAVTIDNVKNSILTLEPFRNLGEAFNELKKEVDGILKSINLGKTYQNAMKSVFEFADFKDPKEEASLKQFYGVENKNRGGIVGLNDGGIAAGGGALNFNVSGKGWGANATISGAGAGGNYQTGLGLQRNFVGRTANEGTIQEGVTKVIEGLGPNLNIPSTAETSIPRKASTVVTLNLDWSGTLGKKQKLEYEKEEDNDPPPPKETKKANDRRVSPELSLPSLRLKKVEKDRFGPPGSPTEYRSIDPKENEMFRNRPDVHLRRTQQANIALEHGDASAYSLRKAFTPMGVPFDPVSAKAFGYHVARSNLAGVDYRYHPSFHARDLAVVEKHLNVYGLKKDESGVPLRASQKVESWDPGVRPEAWEQTLNKGGIVSVISKNIGGEITPKPSMPPSSIKPSISSKKSLIPAPSKGTSLSTPSMSPRYDVSKFNRSLDYEDSTQVIERAVIIVKPVVIR